MADANPPGRRAAAGGEQRPLPPRASMGLLNYITAHSLDEDYAHVAANRERSTAGSRPRRNLHVASVAALAVFGVLVTTAGIQTARGRPVSDSSRESLIAQVKDRRTQLEETRDEVVRLRRQVNRTQADGLAASEAGRAVRDQLATLGVVTGAEPATGPGVRIVVDDNPQAATDRQVVYDKDLQVMVNGLWAAGAEAVSINGQRITNLTSIRVAGEAITVNLRSLSRPYTVNAIGDPDQLPARFVESAAGSWWLNLKSVYGLQFTMTREESLTVPAAPPLTLRHARPAGSGR